MLAAAKIDNGNKYLLCSSMNLKVFSLNCWCIGYVPGLSSDVNARLAAIANFLGAAEADFDFVFLEELWRDKYRKAIGEACRDRYPHQVSFHR
jgi:hypothetical protein